MSNRLLQTFMSLILVLLVLASSLPGICRSAHGIELSGDVHQTVAASHHGDAGNGCPGCPDGDDSTSDHCDFSCNCLCHATVLSQHLLLQPVQQISTLQFVEPHVFIPEVYLSKFVPPESRA